MTVPIPPGITPPSKPRIQREPWGRMVWLVEHQGDGADPGISLAVMTVYSGLETPRHRHANCTEVLYVTAGRLQVRRSDEVIDYGPGDSVLIPKGCPHAARNGGPTHAVAVIAYSAGRRHYQLVPPDG